MKRYTFTVGTGFDKDSTVIGPEQRVMKQADARAYLAATFGGYSEHAVHGGWIDEHGQLVLETSLRFTVLTDNYAKGLAEQAAHYLRELFNQSSVLLEKEEVAASFVEAVPA